MNAAESAKVGNADLFRSPRTEPCPGNTVHRASDALSDALSVSSDRVLGNREGRLFGMEV
jgi:hypothetical protein